jgi:hypothetical protein
MSRGNVNYRAIYIFLRYILFAVLTVTSLVVPVIIMYIWPLSLHEWESWFFIASVDATVLLMMWITVFSPFYLLFCISIGYYKTIAMLAGALNLKSSQSWVVTSKSGGKSSAESAKSTSILDLTALSDNIKRFLGNVYKLELVIGLYYLVLSVNAYYSEIYIMGSALVIMGITFLLTALGDSGPIPAAWSCSASESADDSQSEVGVIKDAPHTSATIRSPRKKKNKRPDTALPVAKCSSSRSRRGGKSDVNATCFSSLGSDESQKYSPESLTATTSSLSPTTSCYSLISTPPRVHSRRRDVEDIESGPIIDFLFEQEYVLVQPSVVSADFASPMNSLGGIVERITESRTMWEPDRPEHRPGSYAISNSQ